MKAWAWFRSRRRGWQIAIVLGGLPGVALLAYVAVRTLLFAAGEKEAGFYVPSGSNVVVRIRELERHWQRIQHTAAWTVLRRRLLKDPAIRGAINAGLLEAGIPTLDDLEDERRGGSAVEALFLRGAGRDAVLSAQVEDSFGSARWCVATRLRWSDFLLTPLGSLVLPSENLGGRSVLCLRDAKPEIFIAFAGALALASNDREMLKRAFERTGQSRAGARPLEVHVDFDRSRALQEGRRTLEEWGLFPELKLQSARALEGSLDIDESAAFVDLALPGAEAIHPGLSSPAALARLAPETCSGFLVTNTGLADVHERLRRILAAPAGGDVVRQNAKEALETLDDGGLARALLPAIDPGLAILTGVEERGGRVYPAFALVMPSKRPQEAVAALREMIRKLGHEEAEGRIQSRKIDEVEMFEFRWPEMLQVNDFLLPCFAALPDLFILGNNERFTEEVILAAAAGGGEFESQPRIRLIKERLREYGLAPQEGLAGGLLLFPLVRESLDGPLRWLAARLAEASTHAPALRAEIEREERRRGKFPSVKEIDDLVKAEVARKMRAKEDSLRESLRGLDWLRWGAFQVSPGPDGAAVRGILEFAVPAPKR
jgi:hypothetical protein